MCGVAGLAGIGPGLKARARAMAAAMRHRGPDAEGAWEGDGVALAHARLAVLDLDCRSDQPFAYRNVVLSYNGELWNYRALRARLADMGFAFATAGDTEVVAAALCAWGAAGLEELEGMFAMAWAEDGGPMLWAARDRFGEVPLHVAPLPDGWAVASELKGLPPEAGAARFVGPGEVLRLVPGAPAARRRWYAPPIAPAALARADAAPRLAALLARGCRERAISDVPVCTLLSGGIDSSAVAAWLADAVPGLVAFTAVLDPRARDLREARRVAAHLGLPLREVRVPAPRAEDLARVVGAIEQPHKAQVEIGWACLCLADAMRAEGFKVTFSGEGSDELWASYGFAFHGLRKAGWHEYRRDLFLAQHRKNFARCNKAFLAAGVECRLPFLHTALVEFALSLPRDAVADGRGRPKAVLQEAAAARLPPETTRRAKVAFQDGMGLKAACAAAVSDPRRFYGAEFARRFPRAVA